ncbi:MAG: carboxypeptidase regulatory-like domain-containing protein [Planctomycetes bacterium]|nr:carboxypeptidase regulatory-like domain-containing protein [Planctomycetota bacterium]MBL7143146.1 carboxypeptidase regulatory-like domain-containing protein [Phycisphaerae bacterium]
MNAILEQINSAALKFVEFALPMFVQSVVLIVILLLADFVLRKKVRAVFRYWIWLLILVKLVLPTSLSSPLSLGYFFGDRLTYADTNETPAETQASLAEPAPVNIPPFIDLTNIEADRFTPAAPPIIPEVKPVQASPADTPAISVTPLSWQGAVFLIWLTVVMAMILLLLQRAIFVRGLVAQAKEANDVMADMLESCRSSMSVKRKLGLKIFANAASPAVCGLFRPVILVPQNLASSLTVGQLRAVLLHELAHIKRGDLFVNLAQTVLQIIYFYNPLLWLANCIIRRIREQAVDEMVLVAMGENAPQYPQTLVSVAKLAFKRPVLSLRLIGVVESKSALAGRIKHILNRPMPKKAKLGIIGLLVIIIIGAILLPMASSMPGPPGLVIKGVVKDAQTGEPIAGARVFDDGYGPEPLWEQIRPDERYQWGAITNSAGQYSFLTWPEHHSIKVEAPGYKAQRRSLYTGHFVFSRKDQEVFDFTLEPEKITGSSEFKTTLPNGVTVELIGICEHPSESKQWWRPDGDILSSGHVPSDHSRMTVEPDETEQARELALRFSSPNIEYMSFRWKIDKATRSSSHPFYMTEKRERLKPQRNIVFKLPRNIETLDFNVGVAVGEWKRVASGGDGRTMSGTNDSLTDSSVIFHEAIKEKDTVRLSATHLLGGDYDCRIIVVDKDDELHEPARSSNSGSDMRLCTGFFDLPSNQIKYILLQARPYQWVEFKNVSLKPKFKTDAQIDVTGRSPEIKVPAAMIGTWFFENPDGDDEQMSVFPAPDGRVVVLYSNGHRDESRYTDGFIGLSESEGKYKMTLDTNGTLVEYFDSGGSLLIGKRWKRIDPQPSNNLLRVLTGPNSGKPVHHVKSEIDWVIEDYGQTRLIPPKESHKTDNWVSVVASTVKNNGRYLVPDRGLTLKGLIKAAGYNRDKLAESYIDLLRSSRQGNITARLIYTRNLKTLFSGRESDIVIKPHDAVLGGYIEPSANGVEFWSGYSFSEVVEMTVNDDGAKVNMFADLDSGKLITPPDILNFDDENAVLRWIKDNGIDVMGETAAGIHGLVGFNMYAASVDNFFWDADPLEFTDRLMVRIDDPVLLSVENLLPVTYLIKTSEYKMGILQILGFVENSKGIKIRYKLLNKEAASKSDVQVAPEYVSGNWQYVGQSIPPDFNDMMILAEHINLGSIGHDAEGKTFITFVRDGQEAQNSQYRFVLFTKDGDILEPDGHVVLDYGERLEEKFTFDEPFITRRLKGFRFQSRPLPPSGFDNISSILQKVAPEVVKAETFLPSNLAPPGRYAIELDGVDDYLLVPDSPSLRLEPPFTIEMWIKTKLPPDASEYRGGWALISKGFTVGTPRAYLTGFGVNLDRRPNEPSKLCIDFCKSNNSGTYTTMYVGYPLTNGVSDWIHISQVFDGDHYKSTPGHPLVMGKFLFPTNNPFKGLIGEVRLWNGARTRQELRQYENVALIGNEPHLAACWTFEQTEGQYAYDISGNNNHARLGKFTGPDDADPKWVDLQAPSPQANLQTDLQAEIK